jgi:DNA-binding NarL/FixJ family response regulator
MDDMRILVVDDHSLIRVGLRHTLTELEDPSLEVLEAGCCAEALDLAARVGSIDLVMLDLNLPDCSGMDGLDRFFQAFPQLSVLALSSNDDPATIRAVLARGAAGYIPKTCLNQILISAVRLVMSGGVYVPPAALLRPADRMPECAAALQTPDEAESLEHVSSAAAALGLTERQAEVMCLVAQGQSNKEIALNLNLAAATVKGHISVILRALNVQTRTQAILALIKHHDASDGPLHQ